MSESKESQVFNIVPEAMNWNRKLNKGTRLGNQTVQVAEYEARQVASQNGPLTWNIPVSTNNLMDSAPEIEFKYNITLTGHNEGALSDANVRTVMTAILNEVGMHSMPNNRIIDSCTVKMNGTVNMSSNPSKDVDAILYNFNQTELKRLSPLAVPDNKLVYDATANTNVLRAQSDSLGWSRGLGAVKLDSISYTAASGGGSNGVITLNVRIAERLVARPFQWHEKEPKAFIGIDDLSITCNLGSSVLNACIASIDAYTCTATFDSSFYPKLRLYQYAPHLNIQRSLPTKCYYNTPMIEYTESSTVSVNAGTSSSAGALKTNVRSYSTVPKLYAVYAYADRADHQEPEQIFPITNLKVHSGIKKNLLQSYSQQDLFELSRRNGYNGNMAMFQGGLNTDPDALKGTGCVIYFRPSDLDSEEFMQSNVENNHTFSVEATVYNHSYSSAKNIKLRLVTFSDAILKYENGIFSEEMAYIRQNELYNAHDIYMDQNFDVNQVLGGNVFGWLAKATKDVGNAIKRIAQSDGAKTASKLARNYIPVARDYLGDNTYLGHEIKKRGYGQKGNGVVNLAGKQMSRGELMQLLDE